MSKQLFVRWSAWLILCNGLLWLGTTQLRAQQAGGAPTVQMEAAAAEPVLRAPSVRDPLPPELAKLPRGQVQYEFKSLPFKPNEKLTYELKFARFPLNVKVGEVTFEFVDEWSAPTVITANDPFLQGLRVPFEPAAQERFVRLRASAISKGMLIALTGIDVNNQYSTLTRRQDFTTQLHWRTIKEGDEHQAQSVQFERAEKRVIYRSTNLARQELPVKTKVLPRSEGMLDLISSFYFLRLQRFKEGELLLFPVSDDGDNYLFKVVIGKRETLKTDCGNLRVWRVEPKLFGPQEVLGKRGDLTMWLTDNRERVPVKLLAKTPSGTITARLLNFKNNCQIAEPGKEELQ